MMHGWPWWAQLAAFVPVYYVIWYQLVPRWPVATHACMLVLFIYMTITDALAGKPAWEVAIDILATIIVVLWLRASWRKRKRRRLAQKLGYKARAIRAKLVKTMKDLRQPRRVLRPAPMPV